MISRLLAGFARAVKSTGDALVRRWPYSHEQARQHAALIASSEHFDPQWYAGKYHLGADVDPLQHFLSEGVLARHDPGPTFSTSTYFEFYPDVDASRGSALLHYELHGKAEGRTAGVSSAVVSTQGKNAFCLPSASLASLSKAADVAARPDAVAVVCWDAAHNPIGRAKVLLDVLAQRRPVVLFAYLFDNFGDDLWAPIRDLDLQVVTIPWRHRALYHEALEQFGFAFETVWMCKPRFPTFLLSAYVAAPSARLVLDLDDNEKHFSLSDPVDMPYGVAGVGLSDLIMERVPTRTVASCSLQAHFGGVMVRHARPCRQVATPYNAAKEIVTIAFVGTVREHKNLVAAAAAVRATNAALADGTQLELHVRGDFSPPTLKSELLAAGAQVGDFVPADSLHDELAKFDIVLAGYPSAAAESQPITQFQISSKIGDALCVGRPVMVPEGPSVADLAECDGVFLFNAENFQETLREVLDYRGQPALPHAFSLEGAYEAFARAEEQAQSSPRAAQVLGGMAEAGLVAPQAGGRPSLLLLWKQQDAGLYGRRVDQLARSYRRIYPEHDVRVLEILRRDHGHVFKLSQGKYLSPASLVRETIQRKATAGMQDGDGIHYELIEYEHPNDLPEAMTRYLVHRGLLPDNTIVVAFPIIPGFDKFQGVFHGYRMITDVVDNQITSWSNDVNRPMIIEQYHNLVDRARYVLFNSAINLEFFAREGVTEGAAERVHLVPNWYEGPANEAARDSVEFSPDTFDVVYSGFLNDRVDWALMAKILAVSDTVRLHLIGNAEFRADELQQLLQNFRVSYYGPRSEAQTTDIIKNADLAVVPHEMNEISRCMSPIKVLMYQHFGIPTVCSDDFFLPEGTAREDANTHEKFLQAVARHIDAKERGGTSGRVRPDPDQRPVDAQRYVELIQSLR